MAHRRSSMKSSGNRTSLDRNGSVLNDDYTVVDYNTRDPHWYNILENTQRRSSTISPHYSVDSSAEQSVKYDSICIEQRKSLFMSNRDETVGALTMESFESLPNSPALNFSNQGNRLFARRTNKKSSVIIERTISIKAKSVNANHFSSPSNASDSSMQNSRNKTDSYFKRPSIVTKSPKRFFRKHRGTEPGTFANARESASPAFPRSGNASVEDSFTERFDEPKSLFRKQASTSKILYTDTLEVAAKSDASNSSMQNSQNTSESYFKRPSIVTKSPKQFFKQQRATEPGMFANARESASPAFPRSGNASVEDSFTEKFNEPKSFFGNRASTSKVLYTDTLEVAAKSDTSKLKVQANEARLSGDRMKIISQINDDENETVLVKKSLFSGKGKNDKKLQNFFLDAISYDKSKKSLQDDVLLDEEEEEEEQIPERFESVASKEISQRRVSYDREIISKRIGELSDDGESLKSELANFSPNSFASETFNFEKFKHLPSSTMIGGDLSPRTPKLKKKLRDSTRKLSRIEDEVESADEQIANEQNGVDFELPEEQEDVQNHVDFELSEEQEDVQNHVDFELPEEQEDVQNHVDFELPEEQEDVQNHVDFELPEEKEDVQNHLNFELVKEQEDVPCKETSRSVESEGNSSKLRRSGRLSNIKNISSVENATIEFEVNSSKQTMDTSLEVVRHVALKKDGRDSFNIKSKRTQTKSPVIIELKMQEVSPIKEEDNSSKTGESSINQSAIDRDYIEEMKSKRTNPPVRRSLINSQKIHEKSPEAERHNKSEHFKYKKNSLRYSNIPIVSHLNYPTVNVDEEVINQDDSVPQKNNSIHSNLELSAISKPFLTNEAAQSSSTKNESSNKQSLDNISNHEILNINDQNEDLLESNVDVNELDTDLDETDTDFVEVDVDIVKSRKSIFPPSVDTIVLDTENKERSEMNKSVESLADLSVNFTRKTTQDMELTIFGGNEKGDVSNVIFQKLANISDDSSHESIALVLETEKPNNDVVEENKENDPSLHDNESVFDSTNYTGAFSVDSLEKIHSMTSSPMKKSLFVLPKVDDKKSKTPSKTPPVKIFFPKSGRVSSPQRMPFFNRDENIIPVVKETLRKNFIPMHEDTVISSSQPRMIQMEDKENAIVTNIRSPVKKFDKPKYSREELLKMLIEGNEKRKLTEEAFQKYMTNMKPIVYEKPFSMFSNTKNSCGNAKPKAPKRKVASSSKNDLMTFKKPKLYMKERWITKRLYDFVQTKLQNKYELYTRAKSEDFVIYLANTVRTVLKTENDYFEHVLMLKAHMAKLNLVETHFDFHQFIRDYLPAHFRLKSIPACDRDVPDLEENLFDKILVDDSSFSLE